MASDESGLSLAKGYLAKEHGAWAPTPSTLKGRAGDAGHCVCVVLARRTQPGCSPEAALPAPQPVSREFIQTSRAQILVNSTESFSDIKVNDLSGGKWPLSLEKAANHGRVKTLGPCREPVSVKVLQALLFVSLQLCFSCSLPTLDASSSVSVEDQDPKHNDADIASAGPCFGARYSGASIESAMVLYQCLGSVFLMSSQLKSFPRYLAKEPFVW